jgi:predicted neuraminidase
VPNTRKAFVTPAGGEAVEVEIPADHPDPEAVAVVAYRKKQNAWGDDRKVSVRFEEEEPAPVKGKVKKG